jgi:CRP-like cAMP-binding protein
VDIHRSVQRREYLIREGELSMETYILIDGGYVVERQSSEGDGVRDHFIHSGIVSPEEPCFVGEMAYLGGSFRTASKRSSGRTIALRLEASHLEIIIDDFLDQIACRQSSKGLRKQHPIGHQNH